MLRFNQMNRLKFNEAGDGDGSGGAGGTGDGDGKGPDDGGKPGDDVVTMSRADYERFKNDLHTNKEERKTLAQQLEDQKVKDMEANDQQTELAKYHDNRANTAEARNAELEAAVEYDRKITEVSKMAQQAGINAQGLEDLDILEGEITKALVIEKTDMGRMTVHGAKEYVERLKAKRPHWFSGKGTNINTNTGGERPGGGSEELTPQDVLAARNKWKKSGTRTDENAYYDLFGKYQKQRA